MVELATRVMRGEKLCDLGYETGLRPAAPLVAVKAPVFSTVKLALVDSALGPEMKSTGEVMGIDISLGAALEKAFVAALGSVPTKGAVLCSIADSDKAEALPIVAQLSALGFGVYATAGTAAALSAAGISATAVGRIGQSRPNVLDIIDEGRVSLIINTVSNLESDELTLSPDGSRGSRPPGARSRTAIASGWPPSIAGSPAAPPWTPPGPGRCHHPAAPGRGHHRGHGARLSRGHRRGGTRVSSPLSDLGRARDESGEVVAVETLDGGMVEITARLPHLAATARPGEFAQLRAWGGVDPLLRRPFSVAWTAGELCSFVLEAVGAGTRLLVALRPATRSRRSVRSATVSPRSRPRPRRDRERGPGLRPLPPPGA